MKKHLALLALGLATTLFSQTAGATKATVSAPAVDDNAAQLAKIVLPREATIAVRLPRFDATYAENQSNKKRLAALETSRPGITAAVSLAARDEAAKAYGTVIDLLQADIAVIYRENFTAAELTALIAFFSSSTGQALVTLSVGSGGETPSAFEADRRAKATATLKNLDDVAKADLTKLMQSDVLSKVRAINPEISALSTSRFFDVSLIIDVNLPHRIEAEIATFPKSSRS